MIGFLRGTIIAKGGTFAIIDVRDVGYRVWLAESHIRVVAVGEQAELYVHHHIREDIQDLFGFPDLDSLEVFHALLSVSGVGPKTAQSIVGMTALDKIRDALARGDSMFFKAVPGIGSKTAERIIVELKDKFYASTSSRTGGGGTYDADIVDALVGLGYQQSAAREAVLSVSPSATTPEERLREALKILGGKKI